MNEIRAAREDDFAAVRGLLAESALVYEDLTPTNLDTFVVIPAKGDVPPLTAVAGLETFRGSREGLLRSVAVSLALRRRGVGASLVAAVEAKARMLGHRAALAADDHGPGLFPAARVRGRRARGCPGSCAAIKRVQGSLSDECHLPQQTALIHVIHCVFSSGTTVSFF